MVRNSDGAALLGRGVSFLVIHGIGFLNVSVMLWLPIAGLYPSLDDGFSRLVYKILGLRFSFSLNQKFSGNRGYSWI